MKNIIIAGASSAIASQAIALFAAQGYNCICISTKPASGHSGVAQWHTVTSYNSEHLPVIEGEVHGLVYFPGSINLKPLNRLSLDDFKTDMDINFFGAVQVVQQYVSNLKKAGRAHIALFSTVAVKQGMAFHASISAAKGAVEGFAKAIAAELAPAVRVNVIAPSLTQTPLAQALLGTEEKIANSKNRHPLKQIGTAQDMAHTLLFLQQNEFITGQIIGVDGGLSALR